MRSYLSLLILALLAVSLSSALAQESGIVGAEGSDIKLSDLVQTFKQGQVDWGARMMYATGEGVMPSAKELPNRARALLKAKEYAKMAAIANLLMVIEGTTITYEGAGKQFMADVTLRQKIEGYVKNVSILRSERITGKDGTIVKAWVGTPMFGDQTPGTAFLEDLADKEKPKQPPLIEIPLEPASPKPSKSTKAAAAEEDATRAAFCGIASARPIDPDTTVRPTQQKGPYTSLVVDARGFNVPQAISPKVRKLNGDQVYGSVVSRTDPAIRDGLVSYVRTPEGALQSDRSGTNPMTVAAIGRGGGRSMCDVIVSDEVAKSVAAENSAAKFLDQYKVIFVVDPPGSALSSAISQAEPEAPARLASTAASGE